MIIHIIKFGNKELLRIIYNNINILMNSKQYFFIHCEFSLLTIYFIIFKNSISLLLFYSKIILDKYNTHLTTVSTKTFYINNNDIKDNII